MAREMGLAYLLLEKHGNLKVQVTLPQRKKKRKAAHYSLHYPK